MDTRDTVVRVHGMSRCAKYQNRTRTRGTRDPITAGIPVPVTNPIHDTQVAKPFGSRCEEIHNHQIFEVDLVISPLRQPSVNKQ